MFFYLHFLLKMSVYYFRFCTVAKATISKAGKLLFISQVCLLPLQACSTVEAQDLYSAGRLLVNRRLTCVFALLPRGPL